MELTDLTKKRQEHIQSCRENNDNSHKIIAGLYSDPSHFIYELLQNSDDAKASEVIFNLSANSLEIKHNGSKLFDFNDVDSITTVGSSTKVDDINSIGTFGAGFKSVFDVDRPSLPGEDTQVRKFYELILARELTSRGLSVDSSTNLDRIQRERIKSLMRLDNPNKTLN